MPLMIQMNDDVQVFGSGRHMIFVTLMLMNYLNKLNIVIYYY